MTAKPSRRGARRPQRGRKRPISPRPRATGSERREAILAAALEEFSARGFAATRLDDVAHRAGVAKGTIYLYFHDKGNLFQELIRSQLSPVVGALQAAVGTDRPLREVAEEAADVFLRDIYGTRRRDVIRLIISEGPRFPQLAEFYYREVIARIVAALRPMLQRAAERGELRADAVIRFPQLLGAPGIIAIVWDALFGKIDPLDARAFVSAHLDLVFGERKNP
jgi:AcrR family transcriptional regulator